MQILIATGNAHKVVELEQLLAGLKVQVDSAARVGGMPEVEESGTTFEANAKLKADALRALAPKEAYVLADDSGLEVDYLEGAPGVYSARYAGPNADDAANRDKLIAALAGVNPVQRTARFRCVLCLLTPIGATQYFEGSCEGVITAQASGSEGFGYDPIFVPEGYRETFGELGEAVKSRLSHRAHAVQALRDFLAAGN
ncbi:MAG: RdgB/HAM1 family non-canonical purine NTP pyrophosphatase [Verrucomicrobia bacterium]|nr:RdgB/HAM1 family non-canonical purine NTP pyrophosphatase [Verrucomicrobiota bacterium]